MVSWPELGTRVTVRYRRPDGSVPPLTDVIGHLLDTTPLVRVRTKTGELPGVDAAETPADHGDLGLVAPGDRTKPLVHSRYDVGMRADVATELPTIG